MSDRLVGKLFGFSNFHILGKGLFKLKSFTDLHLISISPFKTKTKMAVASGSICRILATTLDTVSNSDVLLCLRLVIY